MPRRANDEHAYVVTYDIADQRRWRRVFKLMHGYGRWLQLSVFHCRLDGGRRADMALALERLIVPPPTTSSSWTSAQRRTSSSLSKAWENASSP